MPARRLVKGRNTNQAMHATFSTEQTIGVIARNRKSPGLQSRFFPRLVIEFGELETPPLRPPPVHAEQHFCPVLRFGAPGPWVDRNDGVKPVVLSGEQGLDFETLHLLPKG